MVIQPEELKKLQIFKGPVAPLGTFSARSRVAYSFGILSKDEYDDIDLIRDIRNKFAHQMTGVSFDLNEITESLRKLKGAQIDGQPQSPRECFRKSAIRLMVEFIVRIQTSSK